MNNENFITIQGWMRNDLGLKGNELLVYALIYGFSQDGESSYSGSIAYIADWIGATKQTVYNSIKALCAKEMLLKQESYHNGVKFCSYSAVLPPLKNFDGGVVKNFEKGGQNFLPNNIKENIENKNIGKDSDLKKELEGLPEEMVDALHGFIEMRKKIKAPLTAYALRNIIRKTHKLSGGDVKMSVAIIEQSIERDWRTVYELKEDSKTKRSEYREAWETLEKEMDYGTGTNDVGGSGG